MDDREWKTLRAFVTVDRWTAIAAWILAALCALSAITKFFQGRYVIALVLAVLTVASVLVARWTPSLIKFHN
jgi:hypothetical protein